MSVIMSSVNGKNIFWLEYVWFMKPGTKFVGAYYRDELQTKELMPAVRSITDEVYIFQQ